jgi:hypothetical protein
MRQRRIVLLVAMAVLLFSAATPVLAGRKASTPEERAKAVRLARELEAEPDSNDAAEKRRWLLEWYERVPDITVTVCDLLGPLPKEGHPYFPQVLVQSIFAGGAFAIENPDKAGDQVAVQTASVRGALKVYEAYVKMLPEERLPFLDDLIKKRDAGTLDAHMREAVPEGCK